MTALLIALALALIIGISLYLAWKSNQKQPGNSGGGISNGQQSGVKQNDENQTT